MTSLYPTILGGFRSSLAKLRPQDAYGHFRDIATALAVAGFAELYSLIGFGHIPSGDRLRRSHKLLVRLAGAYKAYTRRELAEVSRTAESIIADADSEFDTWSSIDAQHLLARVQFDEGHLDEAEQSFLQIMDRAQHCAYEEGFVRAIHEISRAKADKVEVIDAEAGFRIALDYYALRALRRKADPSQIPPDASDSANLQVALNCLSSLADTYFLLSRGPTEAADLIDSLGSEFFSSREDSGYDFLEIRGLALNLLTRTAVMPHCANLVGKAMKLYAEQRALSIYALDEATWICDCRGVTYPSTLRRILTQPKPFALRNAPSFKPNLSCSGIEPSKLRHTSPLDAADSIGQLFDYLQAFDSSGRYVYRGQVREYDGPLLPSAFRPILREPLPLKTLSASAFGQSSLRHCGRTFVGEYNESFRHYADIMKTVRDDGIEHTGLQRIFGVYKKLLDDPLIALEQDREVYLSWQDAVQRTLTEAELRIYRCNLAEWNLRIDNYHKRLFRDNVLVRLFQYPLGTTFAQQYGLSSEGLDASKSLSVACFFATHDSSDFLTIAEQGIGVIYRFPFHHDDLATRPLSAFTYYNLPSIVDVEDVFYRFEHDSLEMADAVACMLGYLSSVLTYGLESTDMILLPRGFLRSSRVHTQEAVIVIPDEIREDVPNRAPGPGGIMFPRYRYIEDLKSRPGVVRFYFKHTGSWSEGLNSITREYLWPRDDPLLETLVLLFASCYRLSQAIPKRLDLIDGGYSPGEFFLYCRELYDRCRHQFFTGYENVGRGVGNLIL